MPRGQGVGAFATWSVRDIVLGVVLAVGSSIVLQLAFIGPALVAGYDPEDSLVLGLVLVSTLVWQAYLVVLVYWLVKRRGCDWINLGWRRPWENQLWTRMLVLGIIGAGLASMWLIQGMYVGLVNAAGLEGLLPDQQFPDGIFDEWWLVVLFGFGVILGAPVAEELLFRGLVYGGLRRRFSVLPPALATGALFSVAHLQVGLIIPFSLIGAVLSLVYERTGSIWFNVALHMVFNTASFLLLVFLPDARGS